MSNWKFLCMHCGKENVGEGLGHCPDGCSSPKSHAERLRVAREWVDKCEEYLGERLAERDAKFAVPHINRYVDAKTELALLERGS